MAPDTSARFATGSLQLRAAWVYIWELFTARMAADTSARFAVGSLHRIPTWVNIWELFIALMAQVTGARFAAGSFLIGAASVIIWELFIAADGLGQKRLVWSVKRRAVTLRLWGLPFSVRRSIFKVCNLKSYLDYICTVDVDNIRSVHNSLIATGQ